METTEKDDSHNGIMIALSIPEGIAHELALEPGSVKGGEVLAPDDLHITLVYLGEIGDIETDPAALLPVLSMFALGQAPVTGVINGYGRFVETHKDGLDVCYLNFDSPQLPDFHHDLLQALEGIGYEFEPEHGFTPHITLAYVPHGAPSPDEKLPDAPIPITFDRFSLAFGDSWFEFYLTGSKEYLTGSKQEAAQTETTPAPPLLGESAHTEGMYSMKGKRDRDEDRKGAALPRGAGKDGKPSNHQGAGKAGKPPGNAPKPSDEKDPKRRKKDEPEETHFEKIIRNLTGLFTRKSKISGSEGFITIKEKDGTHRWVSFSSNPYRDRDRQFVSLKALQADVARADQDGVYGPLLFWHTGAKLGDCDYNAMIGKILVESGTFVSPEIGEAVSHKAADLQISLGMLHPLNQPDKNGVFHIIRRYERSILPSGRASNPLTGFLVKELVTMNKFDVEKEAQLQQLLGPDLAKTVIQKAWALEKQADDLGIAFKDFDEATESTLKAKTPPAPPEEDDEEEETPPAKAPAKTAVTIKDMAPDDFASVIAGAVTKGLEPMHKAFSEMSKGYSKKDDETATIKEAQAAQAAQIRALVATIQAQSTKLEQTHKELKAQIESFAGDLPPALADLYGHRPTQSQSNLTTKEKIPNQPQPDPMGDFFKFAAPHVQQNGA